MHPKSRHSQVRKSIAAGSSLALAAGLMVGFGASAAQAAASWTNSTSGVSTVTLPDGVERILGTISGAGGAGGFADSTRNDGGKGGSGAQVTSSLDVSKLDSLRVNVGVGGPIGAAGAVGGGKGGGATSITENGGTIGFIAGGGGGGSQANLAHTSNGSGADGGDGGTANNGGGHDGSGVAGGSGGSKGNGGAAGGSAVTCIGCTKGMPGAAIAGGEPSQTNTAGQGGFGGAGYGGGGGGGTPRDGVSSVYSNGGGGAGGSRADGTGVVQSQFGTAANTGGDAGVKGSSPTVPTAGTDGSASLTWLAAPTSVSVAPGAGKITVSWGEPTQPAELGTPNYEVYLDGKATGKTDNGGSVLDGLTNGQSYAVSVKVTAQQSASPKFLTRTSSNTVNAGPAVAPGAPGTPTIAAWGVAKDDGYVSLKWTPPASNGGAKITEYHVQQQSAETSWWVQTQGCARVTGTQCKVVGLVPNVGYRFKVIAENAIGDGSPSAASTQIAPRYVPPAPKNQAPLRKCAKFPKKLTLKNKTFPVLAPNCKTNAGQPVKFKVTGKSKVGKRVTYAIYKMSKGKYKNYTVIRTYNVKVNLKLTWSAAAKARPIGQPTGQSYKAWSTSKSYKVR